MTKQSEAIRTDIVNARRETKERHEAYREAVKRAVRPGVHIAVNPLVSVNEDADHTCAFIEVVIKVPREALESREWPLDQIDDAPY